MTERKSGRISAKEEATTEQAFRLWSRAACWHRAMTRALRPFQLTPAQYVLLSALMRSSSEMDDAMSQRALAEETGLDESLVSHALRALSDLGLVDRGPDGLDGRRSRVYATSQGERLLKKVRPVADATTRAINDSDRTNSFLG